MNKVVRLSGWLVAVFFLNPMLFSCNSGDTDTASDQQNVSDTTRDATASGNSAQAVTVSINPTYQDTAVSGKAVFTPESDGKIKLDVSLSIPSKANKEVALHIHQNGDCGDNGGAAKGHWNPTEDQHGKWESTHFHHGDIGNIKLDADGNGTLDMTTDLWTIGGEDSNKNIIGKAIIVHGGQDDFTTQPTGNAGDRIGCAVIQ